MLLHRYYWLKIISAFIHHTKRSNTIVAMKIMIDGELFNFLMSISDNFDKVAIMSGGSSRVVSSSRRNEGGSVGELILEAVGVCDGSI